MSKFNLDLNTLTEAQKVHYEKLLAKPFDRDACVSAWSKHDEIVRHTERNGVEAHEMSALLAFLYETFPVVIHRECKTLEGEPYAELCGYALCATMQRFIWCAVVVTRINPESVFETCIADESHLPELLYRLR